MSSPPAVFGPGILIGSRTDISPGVAINVGYVQEFSIEQAGTVKQLFGQNQFPLVAARATIKATGKFKQATVSGIALNALFYGQTLVTGGLNWNIDSTFTTSTGSSQVTVGSSLSFDADLGVKYAATGLPLQRVSTGNEATGFYSITGYGQGLGTNAYNFAGTDGGSGGTAGGTALKITYTNSTTTGQNILVANQPIGNTPTFQLDYYTNLNQPTKKPFVVRLLQCVAEKQMMQFKLEDFMIPELDFSLFANSAGNVMEFVFPEVS